MPLKSWMTQTLMVDVFDWLRTLVVAVAVEVEEGVAVEGDARDHLAQGHVQGQDHALDAGEAAHGQGLEEAVEAGAAVQSHEVGPSHVDAQSQSLHRVLSPVQGRSQSPVAVLSLNLNRDPGPDQDLGLNPRMIGPSPDPNLTPRPSHGQSKYDAVWDRSRSRSVSKGHSKSKSRSRSKSPDKNDKSPDKKDD
uniref:Uncharacterized protein n=1 Tax=Timema shepardi TaxID=629360 RepID=A0A7R9AS62_TIMSH|nr:unnamed protein product [Timema shepardi]